MSRSILFAALSLLVGCTFNVTSFTADAPISTAPTNPTRLSGDFSGLANLQGFGVRVEGSASTLTTSATVTVGGLLQSGVDPSTVTRGVHIDWPLDASDATARRLTIGYDGPALETVWTEGVTVSLPSTTALDLVGGSTSLEVDGVTGPIHLVVDSGSLAVTGAGDFVLEATSGSIDVQGHAGSATCTSGSVALDLTGAIVAGASSGSIGGRFGGGGTLSTTSGSIDVELVGPLDRDLTLSATSGSIHLTVPVGTAMRVETHTGSGSSHVHAGGIDSNDDIATPMGSGAFLVHATAGSGSIAITER